MHQAHPCPQASLLLRPEQRMSQPGWNNRNAHWRVLKEMLISNVPKIPTTAAADSRGIKSSASSGPKQTASGIPLLNNAVMDFVVIRFSIDYFFRPPSPIDSSKKWRRISKNDVRARSLIARTSTVSVPLWYAESAQDGTTRTRCSPRMGLSRQSQGLSQSRTRDATPRADHLREKHAPLRSTLN